mgnify:CR=1 FL=1
MEIRIKETGQVMFESEFRKLYPNTSFPHPISEETLNEFGADVVFEGAQAISHDRYHYSQRQGVEQIDGKWYTKYVLGPVFTDNEEGTAEEQETAYRATIDEQTKALNKAEASRLLAETDWVVLPDVTTLTNKDVFITYRKALRDIAVNPTVDAVFPEKPDTIWA